jgi:thiosulfate reductase cytochrome b subunit
MTRPAFAPGVIEHHARQRKALRKWMVRAAWVLVAACTVYTLAFAAGYHWG